MKISVHETKTTISHYCNRTSTEIRACPICGWWIKAVDDTVYCSYSHASHYGAYGVLRDLDLQDMNEPIREVRSYLIAKDESRFTVSWQLYEETVASVFRSIGHSASVTGRNFLDDGIDIILENSEGNQVGVQVKKHRNSIKIEPIKSLAGALIMNDLTKGVFATTSNFQAGAKRTKDRYIKRGFKIELVNADNFYDALCLHRRDIYVDINDSSAPFNQDRGIYLSQTDVEGRADSIYW